MNRGNTSRGFSMVGMLITMVCIVVLFTIGMNAMNKAVTGEGTARRGTVNSMSDQLQLYALYQSLVVDAGDRRGRMLTPSRLTAREDTADDTTANFFSALVMQNYATPESLISANEFSGYVDPIEDYDYTLYSAQDDVHWDPAFVADLAKFSNASFAHMPFYGERYERGWNDSFSARAPLVGNRGPKDGIDDPRSLTYGRQGVWGGHIAFADGHTDFTDSFTPSGVFFERGGETYADNIFAVEDGPGGRDAILSFTQEMTSDGPVLQFD
jgi:hypothetical protein